MPVDQLPSVAVLMPAYNYAGYIGRAIQSALDQDYPPELLRVIVVDDGSTDDTAAVVRELAGADPQRVTLISQRNSGPSAAINRALAEAEADLIAVLDADDIWLPAKTRRQAELLRDDASLGMVFCDMRVVDGDERTVRPSQVGEIGAFPRRALAALLCQNVATQSSVMIRRAIAKPVPPGIPYSDWWFAVCAASVSEVLYLPEQLALYREHGANLTSGVSGAAGVREHRKEIAFQLWALRNLDLNALTPAETKLVWAGVEEHARRALLAANSLFVELAAPADEDRSRSQALLAQAQAQIERGELESACLALLAALGHDPFAAGLRTLLDETVARHEQLAAAPDPLAGARAVVILADAETLIADEALLRDYAAAAAGAGNLTLAIDATRLPVEQAATELPRLVERCGLSDRDDIDLIAVVGELDAAQRRRMLRRVAARYGTAHDHADGEAPELPRYGAEQVAELVAQTDSAAGQQRA